MQRVRVELGDRGYSIMIQEERLQPLGAFAREVAKGSFALVVTDRNVYRHAQTVAAELELARFQVRCQVLPPGEEQKSLAATSSLYDHLADACADRHTLIVAVGGGVIGDLAGFVAATYARGLPLFMVPTTLLAMVDSSVGGKVGINHARGKNLIGAFHQPKGVWIDPAMLDTLPDREFRSGLAEVVKYGVILDAEFFGFLETNADAALARDAGVLAQVIARCCRLKADVVERDEREETGLRAMLNYGHTFAHAFETVGGYGTWLHGEAVAAGMVCASGLAELRGLITSELTTRQVQLLVKFGLPVRPLDWGVDAMIEVMRRDKKSVAGKMRFILPSRLGKVAIVDDIPDSQVREVLRQAQS